MQRIYTFWTDRYYLISQHRYFFLFEYAYIDKDTLLKIFYQKNVSNPFTWSFIPTYFLVFFLDHCNKRWVLSQKSN